MLGDSSTKRNVIRGRQNMCQSCQPIVLLSTCRIEWGKRLVKCLPTQALSKWENGATINNPRLLLTSMQQHSQTTPPPTTALHFRPSKSNRSGSKLTSLRTTLKLPQTLTFEIFEASNYEGQPPCSWTWRHPQQHINNVWTPAGFPHQ